jgi:hypothetical protein
MLQTKFVEKIKTRILCSVTFIFSKIMRFERKLENSDTARLATDGSAERRVHFACWITKARM